MSARFAVGPMLALSKNQFLNIFCSILGEKFQTRPILRKHKKRHDSEYLEECACKICQKRYATKPHLLRHLKAEHKAGAEMSSGEIKEFFDDYFQLEGGIVME